MIIKRNYFSKRFALVGDIFETTKKMRGKKENWKWPAEKHSEAIALVIFSCLAEYLITALNNSTKKLFIFY